MSLRDEGYEPAMCVRSEWDSHDTRQAVTDSVDALAAFVTSQRAKFFLFPPIEAGTPQSDAFHLNDDMTDEIVDLQNLLGDFTEFSPPIFMRELPPPLPLDNPPRRITADLFGRGHKAESPYPATWTAAMVHTAQMFRRAGGRPRLTGGPFG